MTHPNDNLYSFTTDAHWRAGSLDNLDLLGGVLRVPDRLCMEPIDGTGPEDGCALPDFDVCGRLNWLRPRTGTLVRRYEFGIEEAGVLTGARRARNMAMGCSVIWVLTASGIRRYGFADLDLLGKVAPAQGHEITGMASDGEDGLWLIEVTADGSARIQHLDCWERSCCTPIPLGHQVSASARIAATADGRHVVVLDPDGSDRQGSDAINVRWRLFVVDVCAKRVARTLGFDGRDGQIPTGVIAVDGEDRIHLITKGPELLLETFALTGERLGKRPLILPRNWGGVEALAAGKNLVFSGAGGLAMLVPCNGSGGGDGDQVSTFITPTLISPRGVRSGWNRADVDVHLPEGTTLEITVAATSDSAKIAEIQAVYEDGALSPLDRFAVLQELLDWREKETVTYGAGDTATKGAKPERLRALLDRVSDTHLWIRLTLFTPPGRKPAVLKGLRVFYPSRSYIEDLPAIYREDVHAAAQLRRMLAPFESIFGDLDDAITALPERIDPATAPDEWTGILLTWLGFPVLDDLSPAERKLLLDEAPELLANRGTREVLKRVLDIVTGERASIEDLAEGPAGWFLPDAGGTDGARLGRNTLATAQQPPPFRPGRSVVLGGTPLGQGCADPGLILAQRASIIVIRIEIDSEERKHLEPIIERLLAIFIPAHCRVRVIYTGANGRWRARQLDVDFRLPDEDGGKGSDGRLYGNSHWQLGSITVAGQWQLPSPAFQPAVLDKTRILNSVPRLT